jgi:DNA polymerase III epsilon subunit-like protein
MRRLFYDIETSPDIVLAWRTGWKERIDYQNLLKERAIICIAYKWEGNKDTKVLSWDKNQCDKKMLIEFSKVVGNADECVGHNIDKFDWPWIKTRCLFHGLPPLLPSKTCDTLQWSRRYYYFNSNRLDYIATFLGIGCKVKTEFKLWKEVLLNKSHKSLETMKRYCAWDVVLLEKVWERLGVICPVKTHAGVLNGHEAWTCAKCGSDRVVKHQRRVSAKGTEQYMMHCKECKRFNLISKTAAKQYEERTI